MRRFRCRGVLSVKEREGQQQATEHQIYLSQNQASILSCQHSRLTASQYAAILVNMERKITIRIEADLKRAFDVALAESGHTQQDVLHAAIEQYINGRGEDTLAGVSPGPLYPPPTAAHTINYPQPKPDWNAHTEVVRRAISTFDPDSYEDNR